jgi:uncharacterized membrane protein
VSRGRLEIFSDAVFAVAITLLALNLTIAGPGHGPLTAQLAHQWQALIAYLISFFVIGGAWVSHYALVSAIAVVTRSLLFCNLLLLLFVALIPVATRVLAEYLSAGGFGSHLAAAVYGMVLEGMAIGFFLIRERVLREGQTVPAARRRAVRFRYLPGIVVYLLVIGGAFINPLLALGLSGAVVVYFMFEQMPTRVMGGQGNATRGGSRTRHAARRGSRVSRGRLEIFSDAVFAVAITLLALNLTIAGPGHGPLVHQLTGQWQAFVAYLISFFTIGVIWVNHHLRISGVQTATRPLLFFNLVLLLFVVLIPSATRMLADYLPAGGFGSHLAAAVYGLVLEGMIIGFVLLLEWTLREGRRTQPTVPPDRRRAARLRVYPGLVAYLLVIGAAFINPLLALGLSAAIEVYYALEHIPLTAENGQGNAIRGGSRTRHAALRPVRTRCCKPAGIRR